MPGTAGVELAREGRSEDREAFRAGRACCSTALHEFGESPKDGKTKWTAHLVGKGWKDTGAVIDDSTDLQRQFERDGHKLDLKCSRMVEDKGWCTLTFAAKPG